MTSTPLETFQRNWCKFKTNVYHYSTKQKIVIQLWIFEMSLILEQV